jgi:hypothetical protein
MAELHTIQPSFTRGELSPSMYARVDTAHYGVGCKTMENFFVHPQGGASNTAGTKYIATAKSSTGAVRLIPFEYSATTSFVLEFSDKKMRVIKDGALVLSGASPYELTTTYAEDDLFNIKYTQSADIMFLTCAGYPPRELARLADNSWTITDFAFRNGPFLNENVDATTLTLSAYEGSTGLYGETVTVTSSANLFAAGDVGRWIKIRYMRNEEMLQDGSQDSGSTPWYGSAWPINGKWEFRFKYGASGLENYRLQISFDGGTTWDDYKVLSVTTSWDIVTGEHRREDYGDITPNLRICSIDGDANRIDYELRSLREEVLGFLKITTFSSATSVLCEVKKDCLYIAKATKFWSLGAWGAVPGYPETVMFYQDRLAFANTANNRLRIDLSKTGDYDNFDVSIEVQDDDAITVPLPARSVNAIHSMIPMREMLCFTSGGVWSLSAGSNSDTITPSSIKTAHETSFRAGKIDPVVIGNVVFYLQRFSNKVQSLTFSDTVYGYDGIDMSVMSEHLFEGHYVVDWDYQQDPHSIIWAVRDDGVILGFSFLKEHQVQAWYRRPLADSGIAESVCVIPGNLQDEVYFVVKRTVNGSVVKYIERLEVREYSDLEDAWFVDCGVLFEAETATTTVTGLGHLVGKSVSGVADGVAFTGKTVSAGGTITLGTAASKVIAGLPYNSNLETLNIEFQTNTGTAQARKKRVGEVVLRLKDSKGGYVGPDSTHLMPLKYPANATYPYTGDVRVTMNSPFNEEGRVYVRQSEPYPITILGVLPVVTTGE